MHIETEITLLVISTFNCPTFAGGRKVHIGILIDRDMDKGIERDRSNAGVPTKLSPTFAGGGIVYKRDTYMDRDNRNTDKGIDIDRDTTGVPPQNFSCKFSVAMQLLKMIWDISADGVASVGWCWAISVYMAANL